MRVDTRKGVCEEILKSRDVLSALTDGDLASNVTQGEAGKTLLSRDDIKNECETVKLDAAKGALLMAPAVYCPQVHTFVPPPCCACSSRTILKWRLSSSTGNKRHCGLF